MMNALGMFVGYLAFGIGFVCLCRTADVHVFAPEWWMQRGKSWSTTARDMSEATTGVAVLLWPLLALSWIVALALTPVYWLGKAIGKLTNAICGAEIGPKSKDAK